MFKEQILPTFSSTNKNEQSFTEAERNDALRLAKISLGYLEEFTEDDFKRYNDYPEQDVTDDYYSELGANKNIYKRLKESMKKFKITKEEIGLSEENIALYEKMLFLFPNVEKRINTSVPQ